MLYTVTLCRICRIYNHPAEQNTRNIVQSSRNAGWTYRFQGINSNCFRRRFNSQSHDDHHVNIDLRQSSGIAPVSITHIVDDIQADGLIYEV